MQHLQKTGGGSPRQLASHSVPQCLRGNPIFHLPYVLPSSVSRKSFACHSYENCRVCTNNSHLGTGSLLSFNFQLWTFNLRLPPSATGAIARYFSSLSTAHYPLPTAPLCPIRCLPQRSGVLVELQGPHSRILGQDPCAAG